MESKLVEMHRQDNRFQIVGNGNVNQHYIVRRLTPLECERLQGLPDGYTDIEGATDSKRYKAIGNGMAQPCADFVLGAIKRVYGGSVR